MKLCFATNNEHKIQEIHQLLPASIHLLSLTDIGCKEELAETRATLEGNSLQKADYIYKNYQENVFADDTGLEVEFLDGEPGVISARYAGDQRDNEANLELLMFKLKGIENRQAQFRTVITLILNGKTSQFEGVVTGKIIEERRGIEGFGYDPVFIPDGCDKTFAEMDMSEKNKISHRGRALEKLLDHLKSLDFE